MSSRCVIDVGNTTIASARFERGDVVNPQRVQTLSVNTVDDLKKIIGDTQIDESDEIFVCAGVVRIRELFEEYEKSSGATVIYISGAQACGVEMEYATPETLGPDRIANAIAIKELYSLPAIVIDCGTAITIDVIDEHGVFQGGMIAPGLGASRDALVRAAPSLPLVPIVNDVHLLGTSTIESIQSGVFWGAAHMIDESISRLKNVFNISSVVMTGGDSALFVHTAPGGVDAFINDSIHDEWLTLRGLGLAKTV